MVNVPPKQSDHQAQFDNSPSVIDEHSLPLEKAAEKATSSSGSMNKPFVVIIALVIVLVLAGGVFLGVRLNMSLSKVRALEELTVKNTRQLSNLNELLGRALDANKEDEGAIPPLNLKLSLEFFKHLNELLPEVEGLTFINGLANSPSTNPVAPSVVPESTKRTANAEVRWWKSFFNQFLIPLKSYFAELVHVQVIDSPVSELAMTSASQALIKKEVTLRILTIRQLVLNGLSYEASLEVKEVHAIVAKNFNVNDSQVRKFIAKLDQLVVDLDKMKEGFQLNQPPLKAK